MKTLLIYLFLFVAIMGGDLQAQGFKYKKHYATAWASAGYSLLNYPTNESSDGSLGAAIGGGYTWAFENEVFFTAGAEVNYLSSVVYSEDLLQSQRQMTDTDIPPSTFTMNTSLEDFKEVNKVYYLNLSPSVGYKFKNDQYFIAGLKIGYSLYAVSKTKALATTTATYDEFIDDFEDMPDHFLVSGKEVDGSTPLDFGINVAATLEYGFELKMVTLAGKDDKLRAGVFVDYGFLDINNNTVSNTNVFSHKEDPTEFNFHPIMTTNAGGDKLTTAYFGIKLTYLFNTRIICSCKEGQTQRQGKYKPKKRK